MKWLSKRGNSSGVVTSSQADTPEANVNRAIKAFCGTNGSEGVSTGDEVLHLPVIVEAAESSPSAAKEAANIIRGYLRENNNQNAHAQYNAIMLIRILTDHPGPAFTTYLNDKFAKTVKELLRSSWDPSVQQLLRETLDNFARDKSNDPSLRTLNDMWLKEKTKTVAPSGMPTGVQASQPNQRPMLGDPAQSHHRSHSRRLPAPGELSLRIEEAKTSAKLLQQVCGSTPRDELLGNDLVKEFVERCSIAQRSMQAFIKAENPLPDDETMLTLINTNDQLSAALSSHHRAILEARKAAGMTTPKPLADSDRGAPPHFPQQSGGELMYPPHPSSQQLLLPNIPMNQIAAPPQASQTILQPQPIRPIQMIEAPPTVPARKRVSPPMADSDDPFKDPTTSSGHFPGSNPSGYAEDGMPVEQHMVSLGYSNDGANRVNKPGVEEKITLNEDASTASHGLQKPLLPQYQVPKRLGDPEISPPNSYQGAHMNGVPLPRTDSDAVSALSQARSTVDEPAPVPAPTPPVTYRY